MEQLPKIFYYHDGGETNINSHDYNLLLYEKVNEIVDYLNTKEAAKAESMRAAKQATAEAAMEARRKAAE